MRTISRSAHKLAATALALAMISLVSQAMGQTLVQDLKVVRVHGAARYSVDGNTWKKLEKGAVLKPGAVIQTAEGSYVDLMLGARANKAATPVLNNNILYQPEEPSANVVRIFESSVLAIDKLTVTETGAGTVEETQLDLRNGKIMGNVKKLSNGSKYEVKIPNGVAGIRGTTYMISSSGVVDVLNGEVVIAVVSADGSVVTKVVSGGYSYNPLTQALTPIPPQQLKQLQDLYTALNGNIPTPPQYYVKNPVIIFVSPLGGQNSGPAPAPTPPEGP